MMSNWRLQNLLGAAGVAAVAGVVYGIYKLAAWVYHLF